MKATVRILVIAALVGLLILVRAYGTKLFYDPFIHYFKDDYLDTSIPTYNAWKLWLHIFLRYLVNTVISLAIIYVAFQKKGLVRFSVKF